MPDDKALVLNGPGHLAFETLDPLPLIAGTVRFAQAPHLFEPLDAGDQSVMLAVLDFTI